MVHLDLRRSKFSETIFNETKHLELSNDINYKTIGPEMKKL